jgi:hypothetical protein
MVNPIPGSRVLFGMLLLTISTTLLAQPEEDCPRPDSLDFSDLDGSTISESALMDVQSEVQGFANAAKIYLRCLWEMGGQLPRDEQEPVVATYNAMVEELQQNVESFNTAVRVYRERMEAQAAAMENSPAE